MTIFGTCGHELTEDEGLGIEVTVTGYCYDFDGGSNAVVYEAVCSKCYELMKKENVILENDEEELWLAERLDRPVWHITKS